MVAIFAAWRCRQWKRRAQACQKSLHALGFEVANATSAARAHLIDFRRGSPDDHLEQLQAALDRLSAALAKM
jgi:hypothetical protein